jgi:hypothetical protein
MPAAMRPRRNDRGNRNASSRPIRRHDASMRPRHNEPTADEAVSSTASPSCRNPHRRPGKPSCRRSATLPKATRSVASR